MKKQYKTILVAVDGSDQSYNALHEAVKLAKRNDGKLHILTVIDIGRYYGMSGPTIVAEIPRLERVAEEIIDQASRLVGDGINFETHVATGRPTYRIIDFAKENKIDLIVIGATGADVIDKFLLGSTTQYVVNHAPCNVMVVK